MEINGYPTYLIYEDGRIYSKYLKKFRITHIDNNGYIRIRLCKDGIGKTFKVHRLVAEHYIPNVENKPQVDHINRNRSDNRVENLRWVTRSENGQNQIVHRNSKTQIKNISYLCKQKLYQYTKKINKQKHSKYFKTLEEAIEYKKNYERQ
jgi:hypothetical protein